MLLTENILDPGGELIASARFGEVPGVPTDYYFYNYDKRGSTTAILQPDGTLKKGYEYDEFGNLEQSGDADFLNDVTFTGSVVDMSTGLQYMNARYYNPKTGRFLSQDKYSGNPYDPWTQHLYSYCGNNPTNFIDPTGHRWDETCAGLGNGRPKGVPYPKPKGSYSTPPTSGQDSDEGSMLEF